jgi:type II secretory pathway pseudopilin PulG
MSNQRGFAYLALLLMVAALGIGLASIGPIWASVQQRDKEKELLHIGEQFRKAIASYYESSPGVKQYPPRLEDLLLDPRLPGKRRHLRKIYRDPMTNSIQWGTVDAPTGGIMGVYSRSLETPLKQQGFQAHRGYLAGKAHYMEWVFGYAPTQGNARQAQLTEPIVSKPH